MKRKIKTIFLLLMIVLLTGIFPLLAKPVEASTNLSSAEVTAKLDQIKANSYPAGSYFTSSFGGGIECYAFGRWLANEVFGSYPWNCSAYSNGYVDKNGWQLIIGPDSSTNIEPGDIIEVRNSGQHTATVWKTSGSTIYVGECWGSYGCKIAWGYFNGNSNCSTLGGIISRYGQSNVYIWKRPGGQASSSIDFATIDLGTYYIRAKSGVYLKPTKVSTDSDDQQIGTSSTKSDSMRFEVLSQSGGYSFKSYFNSQDTRINVWATNPSAGKHVTIYAHTGHSTQTWKLRSVGDGYAIVLANYSNLAITLENGTTILRNYTGADNQVFYFEPESCEHGSYFVESTTEKHTFTCSRCGEIVYDGPHYGGTATCTTQAACSLCSMKYGSLKSHSYTVLKTDSNYHWYQCANCTATTSKTAHSGGTATCTKKATCSTCKIAYGSLKSHIYSTAWGSDVKSHWHICTSCGSKDTSVTHTPGAAATETTSQNCTVCGYVLAPATGHIKHNYTITQHNETHHWNRCSGCSQTDQKVSHSGGQATCTEKAVCSVCKTGYGEYAQHAFTLPQTDRTHHWNKCANCEATDTKQLHSGGEATCLKKAICTKCSTQYGELAPHQYGADYQCTVCGVTNPEKPAPTEPSTSVTDPTEQKPTTIPTSTKPTASTSQPNEPTSSSPVQYADTVLVVALIVACLVIVFLLIKK